jgi:ribosomal protein S1
MTSPDLPQDSTSNTAHGDAQPPSPTEPKASAASSEAKPSNEGAPSTEASSSSEHSSERSHEGAPQPGNAASADASADGDDEGDDDGPAPGNERASDAQAGGAGQPGVPGAPGTGKRKRRRRKKGGAGAAAGAGGAPALNADGTPVAEGEAGAARADGADGAAGDAGSERPAGEAGGGADASRRRDKRGKKDRGPRDARERPAFNVGDVTFGKILEITDDAVFVDLSGKGRAIFDRRELELPDEPPAGEDDEDFEEFSEGTPAEGDASTAPAADGSESASASGDAGSAEGGEPAAEAASAPAAPAAPAGPSAEVVAAAETAPSTLVSGAPEGTEPSETPAPADAPKGEGEEAAAGGPAPAGPKPGDPQSLPAVVLELGAHFVGVVHNDGGRGGLVVLTRHPRRARRAKLVVAGAFKEKGEVLGLVTGVIKGGVEVDVDGLRAFAPGSHMDMRLGADLHPLVGKRLMFQVTQYAKKGRDVVLSRRAFLEIEARAAREDALKKVEIGKVVDGVVRSVVSFGAFVDIGGIEGLVPLSEMSHNRGDGPHDVFKQGETVPVKVLRIDEKGKLWLSRKAATPDPWSEVAKKYAMGTRHSGKVARLQPFGVFVELESGIDGLIHTADLSVKRIEHPSEVVKEGDVLDVIVAHLDIGAHKIGLHPAPAGAAADEAPQRVQVHKPVKVAVVGHDAGGLFVRILGATGRHARGFITAASTGTPRGSDLRKLYPMNTILDAKVIELDPKRGEVKLSIRALSEDTERTAYRQYRDQVNREAKFGTFADLLKKKG